MEGHADIAGVTGLFCGTCEDHNMPDEVQRCNEPLDPNEAEEDTDDYSKFKDFMRDSP
jgi:hypothetical protein